MYAARGAGLARACGATWRSESLADPGGTQRGRRTLGSLPAGLVSACSPASMADARPVSTRVPELSTKGLTMKKFFWFAAPLVLALGVLASGGTSVFAA